jgi:hypothetical protein
MIGYLTKLTGEFTVKLLQYIRKGDTYEKTI